MTTMTYPSKYSKEAAKALEEKARDYVEEIFHYFDIEYFITNKIVFCECPIHGGDNERALTFYYTGEGFPMHFKCRTRNCHSRDRFNNSVYSFIRGILSHRKYGWREDGDKEATFMEAYRVLKEIVSGKKCKSRLNFPSSTSEGLTQAPQPTYSVDRFSVRQRLQIPSTYHLNRGYSSEILDRYDVGICWNPAKPQYKRSVVPIYDLNYKEVIGVSGRSIYEKCEECNGYHDPLAVCKKYAKWKHSRGFRADETLYNLWFSKDHIVFDNLALVVESPGDIWKLEESEVKIGVGVFGCTIHPKQIELLQNAGALKIGILMNNDKAGRKAAKDIERKCRPHFETAIFQWEDEHEGYDVTDLGIDGIDTYVKPFIETLR